MNPDRRRKINQVLAKLMLLAVSTTVSLLLLEFAVRKLMPYYDPRLQIPFTRNAEGVITGFPGKTSRQRTPKGDFDFAITFNREGFRDSKDTATGKATNIYVAGDSFSIGWGVDESKRYSTLMEKQLGVPVYNISIPEDLRGYLATVKYAEHEGAVIKYLVVGLCMENDIWDYSVPVSTHVLYARDQNKGWLRAVCTWFKGHSAVWICASHQIQRTHFGRTLFEKIGIAKGIEALTHKNDYNPKSLSASRDELLKLTTNYNSVVLIIPSRGLWYGGNISAEQKVHEGMVELLRDAGVRFVDMRPVFEKLGDPLQNYFVSDPHWNDLGHQRAAEELCRYLSELPDWKEAIPTNTNR